jgi:putative ABC transport system ATP-binding protein
VTAHEIRAESVRLVVGSRVVQESYSFSATSGELVGVRGGTGCGKTTLLRTLAGLAPPAAGRILFDGVPALPWRDGRAALVLQPWQLAAVLTATEMVALPLQAQGLTEADIGVRVGKVMLELGLDGQADQVISELSGGQRQRVGIAQALARRPDLLLADEPTTALDTRWQSAALDLFREAARDGSIVVIASNDAPTLDACDRLVTMGLEAGVSDGTGGGSS